MTRATDDTHTADNMDNMDSGKNMTTHLTDEDLVLHYYGELTASEETHAATHLTSCTECHENLRRLQRVLAVVDERALVGPELPEHFERTVWARLEADLPRTRGGWASWLAFSPGRLVWVATVALLVGAAFMAGRLLPHPENGAAATTAATAPGNQLRERILLVDLGEHLDRSQMVLVELVSAGDENPVDISDERARAEQLVAANRLYRQTAVATGDAGIADLLDELERVLVDLAASPEQVSSDDLNEVRQRIESRSLLFKVRVLSADVRQRQKSMVQTRAGNRSSL
jgi:anti-sigma factor RsiW